MVPIAVASPETHAGSSVTSKGPGLGLVASSTRRGRRAGARGRRSRAFRLSFAPRASSASMLRAALTHYLTVNRIDDHERPKIMLCANEAFINAVEHAPDSPVSVAAEIHDDRLVLEVRDGGPGFDPSPLDDDPLPDLMGEHGRGLFLIRQLTDGLEVLSDGNGTTLRMALGLGVTPGAAREADDTRGLAI